MRKKLIIILDLCIVLVLIFACVLGKKAFDKYKMEKQQVIITEKQMEIQSLQTAFEQETDRAKKLDLLKSTQESYDAYRKEKEANDACVEQYESVLVVERTYFEEDYQNTISANSMEDIDGETDREKLNTCRMALTELKHTIQTEYDTYKVITKEKFTDYNTMIDNLVSAYSERIGVLDEEELQMQQEEEQDQETKVKAQESEKTTKTGKDQDTASQKKNSSTSSNSSRSNNASSRSDSVSENTPANSNVNSDSGSNSNTDSNVPDDSNPSDNSTDSHPEDGSNSETDTSGAENGGTDSGNQGEDFADI